MFQSKVTLLIILYLVAYFTVVNEFKRGIAAGSCHRGHGSVLSRKLTNDSWKGKAKNSFNLLICLLSLGEEGFHFHYTLITSYEISLRTTPWVHEVYQDKFHIYLFINPLLTVTSSFDGYSTSYFSCLVSGTQYHCDVYITTWQPLQRMLSWIRPWGFKNRILWRKW